METGRKRGKQNKWHHYLVTIVLFVTLVTTLFSIPHLLGFKAQEKKRQLFPFATGWTYTTDEDSVAHPVTLPAKLLISETTNRITLRNTIPSSVTDKSHLSLPVMFQEGTVTVNGEERAHYGDASSPTFSYPFRNAGNILLAPLSATDQGKEIVITLQSPHTLGGELSLLRVPIIGDGITLTIDAFFSLKGNIPLTIAGFFFLLLIACMLPSMERKNRKALWPFLLLLFLWLCYFASGSPFFAFLFHFSPRYAAATDFLFYLLDYLLPFLSFLVVASLSHLRVTGFTKMLFLGHGALIVFACIGQLIGLMSINIMRPYLMAYSFVVFLLFLRPVLHSSKTSPHGDFVHILLLLLGATYADYIRYALTVLPLNGKTLIFLQLGLPFQLALGIALCISMVLLMQAIIRVFKRERQELRDSASRDFLTGVYTRDMLGERFSLAQESGDKWYFALMDIDDFKHVNDTLGHIAGDRILCLIADLLSEVFQS